MRIPGSLSVQSPPRFLATRLSMASSDSGKALIFLFFAWFGSILMFFLVPLRIILEVFALARLFAATLWEAALLTMVAAFLSIRAGGLSMNRVSSATGVLRVSASFRRTNSIRWRRSLRNLAETLVRGDERLRNELHRSFPELLP